MSELGGLMCSAETPPVRVRYRVWHDHGLAQAARDAHDEELVGVLRLGPPAQGLPTSEIIASIWRLGQQLRIEHRGGKHDGAFAVGLGERWWSWSPERGALSSDQCAGAAWIGQGAERFLDPRALHDALRFEPTGDSTRLGRPVLVANAWPRSTRSDRTLPADQNAIGVHADRYRVEVDAERGLVLSVHALFAGQPFQTIDVIDLQLDGPLNMDVFEFREPLDGATPDPT